MDEHRRRGNYLVTPAVQMTAAASGSSGIAVPDSDEYDFGAGDFAIVWEGSLPNWRLAPFTLLAEKLQNLSNYVQLYILSDGTLRIDAAVAGITIFSEVSSSSVPASYAGKVVQLVFSVTRETSGAAGSFVPYLNSAILGVSQAITAAATTSISNTGALYVAGTSAARFASNTVSFILLNFAPTANQVSTLYSSGIPDEWMWGSNVAQTSGTLTVGKNYRINTFVAGDSFTNVGAASNASGVQFTAIGTTPTTWTNGSSLVQTGAALALLPETLPTSGALEWPDSSSNDNDGTLPATGATKVVIRR